MIDYSTDFSVTDINSVIERKTERWTAANISFPTSYVMAICLSGKAEYTISDNSKIYVKENNVLLFPPNNVRSGKADDNDPWHFISVNFNIWNPRDTQEEIFKNLIYSTECPSEPVRAKFKKLSSLWKEKKYMYKPKCRILIEEILLDLLALTKNDSNSHSHFKEIEEVSEYLHENFTKNISVKDLVKLHGLSETHFRKLFCMATGMSVKEYLIKLRLDYATELLSSGEFNISETANLCGFSDVYYFSSLFKKKYGYPPSKITKK